MTIDASSRIEAGSASYSRPLIGLHWLMALLIVGVFASMELSGYFEKGSAARDTLKSLHFMLGLSVLALVVVRMFVRSRETAPAIVPTPSPLIHFASRTVHVLLYAIMFAMPIAGWLILSAAGRPIPFFGLHLPALIGENKDLAHTIKEVHETVGNIAYYIIGLHALGALVHHYAFKDNTLKRMLPSV